MKKNFGWKILFCAAAATFIFGCATPTKTWNPRIGTYTFDQAVKDFGPPDKQAKLSNGQTVAEWVTHHYTGGSVLVGSGFYGYPGSVGVMQTVGPNYYEDKLRLTFTTNNILSAWSED